MKDHISLLRQHASENNIILPEPEDLKKNTTHFVRFSMRGRDKDWAYRIKEVGGELCAWYGSWKGGWENNRFFFKSWEGTRPDLDAELENARLTESQEELLLADEAAENAHEVWATATPAAEAHPYLVKKEIPPIGDIRSVGGVLVIPLKNSSNEIRSLQKIDAYGEKRFSQGSKTEGCFWFFESPKKTQKIYLCEGYATAISVYLATGLSIAISFGSSNLIAVAKELKKKHPAKTIELAADIDRPGKNSMPKLLQKWKHEIKTKFHEPEFSSPGDGKDFNDLMVQEGTPAVRAIFEKGKIPSIAFDTAKITDFPPRPMIVDPFLRERSIGMIYSKTGCGKTLFSMSLCMHIARGVPFLGWKTVKKKIFYIDAEMEMSDMLKRRDWIKMGNDLVEEDGIRLLNRSIYPEHFLDPLSDSWFNSIRDACENYDLLVIDNISTLFGSKGGDTNKDESWERQKDFFFSMRFSGKSVLFLHHANKRGDQSGTSAKTHACDYVIRLDRQPNKSPIELSIKGTFEKGRGGNFEAFGSEIELDGHWIRKDIEGSQDTEIVQRYESGQSIRDIESALSLPFTLIRKTLADANVLRARSEANKINRQQRRITNHLED